MADGSGDPAIHIVYTERPVNDDPQAFHFRTLISVLGSEQAAREALIYIVIGLLLVASLLTLRLTRFPRS